jgi:hypothetical protein
LAGKKTIPGSSQCDGQGATGAKIPTLFQLLDNLGGNVSEQRRAEMSARYPQKC